MSPIKKQTNKNRIIDLIKNQDPTTFCHQETQLTDKNIYN